MTIVIDYGAGNSGSIVNMFRRLGHQVNITSDIDEISKASKLILPGVGSFDFGMMQLSKLNLINVLHQKVLVEKTPILGICLGVQLFTEKSEEGKLPGLGWIKGETIKFKHDISSSLKIPHMGWNYVNPVKQSRFFGGIDQNSRFYFVHSYHLVISESENILACTDYGIPFTSAIERDNILGVQFHPEKSHRFGMKLFSNFLEY